MGAGGEPGKCSLMGKLFITSIRGGMSPLNNHENAENICRSNSVIGGVL